MTSQEKDICCICFDENDENGNPILVRSTNCRCREAIYHQICLDEYIKYGKERSAGPNCPICKKKFLSKEEIKYHLNLPVLYVYFLVISLSLLMEYFLPSSTSIMFLTQMGFILILTTAIYYKEVLNIVYSFVKVKAN